jgi:peptide/nickel transport system permease protein
MNRKTTKVIGMAGIFLVLVMITAALAGPLLSPHDANMQSGAPFEPPSKEHPLGTDDVGHDLLTLLFAGARISLFVGIASALSATIIGSIIGLLAGYFRGWMETLLMRLVDVSLTLPFLPLMIVISVYLGPGLITQIFVITLVVWASTAREIRAQSLSLRGRGPVLAAQSMGADHLYVLRRHVLPGIIPLMIPQFVRAVNIGILMEASLSFLGLGDPTTKSWGSILYYANARSAFLTDAWLWWVLPPGICIVITVLSISFLGYFLEERVSPRLRSFGHFVLSSMPSSKKGKMDRTPINVHKENYPVLKVNQLSVDYQKDKGFVHAVDSIDFSVYPGEVLGVVGESGSGKTTVAAVIMQLLKPPGVIRSGSIHFCGQDLSILSQEEMQKLRGNRISIIPQAAMNALNPVLNVREQLIEAMNIHRKVTNEEARAQVNKLLEQVGLSWKWGLAYPHELSGGMRQRVVIAMALINDPQLVIADEPTTGLDVIVQAEIIRLLKDLQKHLGLSMILISHDLPVVLTLADRLVIMKDGTMVDQGLCKEVVRSNHPYTRCLINAIPKLEAEKIG